ncbi:hypothetical protein AB0J38_11405 [Streptomyces sp. NPDC050095]|uniref:pPIWI_RE_Y domain-containing protein n=1 Tax=unclassified Streptomyces TaxID=2593676 RepID=UPI00342E4D37
MSSPLPPAVLPEGFSLPGHDSPERESEVLLGLIASGLMKLAHWRGEVDRRRPYDGRLQLGLDRLAVACARRGLDVPIGVGDLVWEWCARRPMHNWPVVLDPDVQADGELLLINGAPSEFCREWARSTNDVVADVHESALVEHVKDVAGALGRPELYAHWRLLVTQHAVVSASELLTLKNRFLDVPPWATWLDQSYEQIPPEATVEGRVAVCSSCEQWADPAPGGRWTCPSWRCALRHDAAEVRLVEAAGLRRLRRELVIYIALPGRPELELAEALAARGAHVVLYPLLDALDLVATWRNGTSIGVDVKDWRKAYLLARRIKRFPEWRGSHPYAYQEGFVAVPDDRTTKSQHYLRILHKRSVTLQTQRHVSAITISRLVRRCPDDGPTGEITCGP